MRKILLSLTLCLLTVLAGAQEHERETSAADQVDIAVTAYNNGLALIRDVRALQLPSGEILLKFSDVAQQIRPETVSLRSLSRPGTVRIIDAQPDEDLDRAH